MLACWMAEALGGVKAADDPELVPAARAILEQVQKMPRSSYVAVAAGGSTASASVNPPVQEYVVTPTTSGTLGRVLRL